MVTIRFKAEVLPSIGAGRGKKRCVSRLTLNAVAEEASEKSTSVSNQIVIMALSKALRVHFPIRDGIP